ARGALLDPAALETALNAWEERHPETSYEVEQTLSWLTAWAQTRPRPSRISVVLPGRPEMAQVSAALRDGLLAAWLEQSPDRRPELIFSYIGAEPDAIMSAWFDAREAGADFMLGPLEREQVDLLLTLPDPALPVLMLNHPSDPASFDGVAGPIHAIGLLPEEEAELAAVHALVQGHARALVLYQDSDWGRRVAPAFANTFELGGGQVIGRGAYPAGQVDHSALLESLLQLDQSAQRARRLSQVLNRTVESEPHRRTDVDLIFLGSRAEDGRQVRPQLRFFGAGDVPVLATSQIVAGRPDPRRDEDLDGIVLPLSPWFLDHTPQGQQRRQAERVYSHLDNPALSRLHALGFDAMALIPWLDLMRNDPDLYLAGLSGRLRLPEGRIMERDLPFVRLVNGRAVPVQ
ncbi:MAG: penicillin-binding protein activator, partial [Wenzhouxiangella sp.]